MKIKKILDKSRLFFRDNGSTILSIIAVGGVIGTSILTALATSKTVKKLDKVDTNEYDPETGREIISYYIPPVLVGFATISSIIGSNALNKHNQAVLASTYAMLSSSYSAYRNKNIEINGKEADENVRAAMVRENCNYHAQNIDVPDQKVIFYDCISEQSIECYEREIMDAEYHFNRNYTMRGYATLNEFYSFVGFEPTNFGAEVGWSTCSGIDWVDFEHKLIEEDDGGTPIYSIDYIFFPDKLDWWEC